MYKQSHRCGSGVGFKARLTCWVQVVKSPGWQALGSGFSLERATEGLLKKVMGTEHQVREINLVVVCVKEQQ